MSSEVSERARVIERTLLESVTYSDDAQRVPALQYISNRAFAIAAAIEAALSAPPIDDEVTQADHDAGNAAYDEMVAALGNRRSVLIRAFARNRIAAAGEVRRRTIEECARVVEAHADDRGGRDRPLDWHDGYMNACQRAASATRSLSAKEDDNA